MEGRTSKLVPLEKIEAYPGWPNYRGAVGDVTALAESIGRNGLQSPLRVRMARDPLPTGHGYTPRYYLAAGFRRFAAINLLVGGLDSAEPDGSTTRLTWTGPVPVSVADLDDPLDLIFDNLTENIQREDPDPVSLGRALVQLQASSKLSLLQISTRLGRSHDWVQKRVAFIRAASPAVIEAVVSGDVSEKTARAVVKAAGQDAGRQKELVDLAAKPARDAKEAGGSIRVQQRAAKAALAPPPAPVLEPPKNTPIPAKKISVVQAYREIERWQTLRATTAGRTEQAAAVQFGLSNDARTDAVTGILHGFSLACMLLENARCACGAPMVSIDGPLPKEHVRNTEQCG